MAIVRCLADISMVIFQSKDETSSTDGDFQEDAAGQQAVIILL